MKKLATVTCGLYPKFKSILRSPCFEGTVIQFRFMMVKVLFPFLFKDDGADLKEHFKLVDEAAKALLQTVSLGLNASLQPFSLENFSGFPSRPRHIAVTAIFQAHFSLMPPLVQLVPFPMEHMMKKRFQKGLYRLGHLAPGGAPK